ncbi:hypothetical protein GCM10009632_12500 [Mycolicibacterium alvei]|uniref:AMP-dependent synthetase/ligase domain-containing protein n=1 Tax=Mycolicibacterium alvei TaxID=67081 RepID=A0A6N4UQ44_9MYCO|nr:hypothetical protein MALV_21050 [Mycolicibacterium alvei]
MSGTATADARFDRTVLRDRWCREGWYSGRTLIDALESGAAEHGDTPVVFVADGVETASTVAEIFRRSQDVAAGLQRLGIGTGDVVAVQLTNRLECAIAYGAVLMRGATLIPIVHMYGPSEVGFILAESRAKVLIMPARFRSLSYLNRFGEFSKILTLEHLVIVEAEPGDGYLSWPELSGPEYRRPSQSASPDGVAVLIYTSGTTSAPKGVQHSHNSINAEQRTLPDLVSGGDDVVQLVTFPPGHIAGVGTLLRPLISGSRSVFMDGWDPATAVDIIQRHRVTASSPASALRRRRSGSGGPQARRRTGSRRPARALRRLRVGQTEDPGTPGDRRNIAAHLIGQGPQGRTSQGTL